MKSAKRKTLAKPEKTASPAKPTPKPRPKPKPKPKPQTTARAAHKAPPRKPAPRTPKKVSRKPAQRADYGAPIDGFFAKQPAKLRPILDALRELVEQDVPDAESSLKWGMPFYTVNGVMMCAIGGHKSHVNLILAGPPNAFDDPHCRLIGAGKTGRHLKLTALEQLPRAAVRGWLRRAAELARGA